jgi:hypothetical protein
MRLISLLKFSLVIFFFINSYVCWSADVHACQWGQSQGLILEPGQFNRASISGMDEITLASFNLYNIAGIKGQPGKLEVPNHYIKTPDQADELARSINLINPDVLAVQEVFNLEVLNYFCSEYLKGRYKPFLIPAGGRGIQSAFLVKRWMPFEIELRTQLNATWVDPAQNNKVVPVFTRDLPLIVIRRKGKPRSEPLFYVLLTHQKSQLDRPGDRNSVIWRTQQAHVTAHMVRRLSDQHLQAYGTYPNIIVMGDFNSDVKGSPSFSDLWTVGGLKDVFDMVNPRLTLNQRWTHIYYSPEPGANAKAVKRQLDAILVSKALFGKYLRVDVVRSRDRRNNVLRPPANVEELLKVSSDHALIAARFYLPGLFP